MTWHTFAAFESSNIQSIRYNSASMVLEVTFLNGSIYEYFDVPAQVATDFENFGSKGQFLAAHIKGHYRYSKV